MYNGLKSKKAGKTWASFVDYTVDEFISHLESLFEEGMTLDNHGLGKDCWHIDHVIPIRYILEDGSYYWNQEELGDPSSSTFKRCWALDNLQPLWSTDNLAKSNKFIGKQPLSASRP